MSEAYIVDGLRTPFGRYGGSLSSIRCDDLAALPMAGLRERHQNVDWSQLDDVILGCANQAGEDNRNVARMAVLLAGFPIGVPGVTLNRLCGSGLDAVGTAARAIRSGECELMIAGGVESMSRAPFVMGKAETAFSRSADIFDTTIGWRFINSRMRKLHGVDSMPQTAENVANDFGISRQDQDAFALRSQKRWVEAQNVGRFESEMTPVSIQQRNGDPVVVSADEHPRPETSLSQLGRLNGVNGEGSTVTAGNASGVNDGAAAVLLASDSTMTRFGLAPLARVVGMAVSGIEPKIMGYGPVAATQKLLQRTGLSVDQMDVIELNEAFAAQALAVLRGLGIPDDASHVNPNGGAIAIGHPLGASGARLALTAAKELVHRHGRYALCTMCIGVGQGIALILERV
jgi:acetyl-CoA acyltransferase